MVPPNSRAVPQEDVSSEDEGEEAAGAAPHVPSMTKAIAKAFEITLCNVLGSDGSINMATSTHKRSPQRKRIEDREVALEKVTEPSHH